MNEEALLFLENLFPQLSKRIIQNELNISLANRRYTNKEEFYANIIPILKDIYIRKQMTEIVKLYPNIPPEYLEQIIINSNFIWVDTYTFQNNILVGIRELIDSIASPLTPQDYEPLYINVTRQFLTVPEYVVLDALYKGCVDGYTLYNSRLFCSDYNYNLVRNEAFAIIHSWQQNIRDVITLLLINKEGSEERFYQQQLNVTNELAKHMTTLPKEVIKIILKEVNRNT